MSTTDPQLTSQHDLSKPQILYLWFASISCACFLIGDIIGIKLFSFPLGFSFTPFWSDTPITNIVHTCGMLTFPVTFLITDLVNEYYGKRAARRIAYVGVAMNLMVFAVINIAQYIPRLDAPYNVDQGAFDAVFGSAKGMYIASTVAYLVGQLSDITIFGLLKRVTKGKLIWLRATGSTLIAQALDSLVVSIIAFHYWRIWFPDPSNAPAPIGDVLELAATGYLLKFVIAIGITPLIYAGHTVFERVWNLKPLPA